MLKSVAAIVAALGETVTLVRKDGPQQAENLIQVKARVKETVRVGDVVGGQDTRTFEVRFTNVEILAAQWPGPPRRGDWIKTSEGVLVIDTVRPGKIGEHAALFICEATGNA